jgi:hypothetical protein
MEINRSNYEIWLIDYLDGNLDADRLLMLSSFLKENPDIEQEFNFFEEIKIIPDENKYHYKTSLTRIPSDLSDDQLSYLCIAFAENDLSQEQSVELLEIIAENPSGQKIFNIINKLKLKPAGEVYLNKNMLKKENTRVFPVLRIAFTALSIAASIALFFLVLYNPGKENSSTDSTIAKAENQVLEKTDDNNDPVPVYILQPSENKSIPVISTDIPSLLADNLSQYKVPDTESGEEDSIILKDSINIALAVPGTLYFTSLSLATPVQTGSLLPVVNTKAYPFVIAETNGLKYYITTFFRKNISKDKIRETGPLKGYEIAEAGIDGLNKILGWDMSFEKMKDKNGDLSSLAFSSRLIKFNTPAKKFIAQK